MSSFADILYEISLWIRDTPIPAFSLWIADQPISLWLVSHFFAIPTIQTLHILAIAVAFGSVLMVNLRILGIVGEDQSLTQMVNRFMPWTWGALAMLLFTGFVLIVAEPVRELMNPMFWLKMVLVVGVTLFSIGFHITARRNAKNWAAVDGTATVSLRGGAAVIIILWCVVIFAGRWIAYAPV